MNQNVMNACELPLFQPRLYEERGFLKFDDGRVHAELERASADLAVIWDWLSVHEGRGCSAQALRWIRAQGFTFIDVVDATKDALPFWRHMQTRGLVNQVSAGDWGVSPGGQRPAPSDDDRLA